MKPITPKEFKECYGSNIPDIVIEVVNELIKSKATYEGISYFIITQPTVVNALLEKGINRDDIFRNNMLDFEPDFRKMGWTVKWNKGAYYEDASSSYWEFSC